MFSSMDSEAVTQDLAIHRARYRSMIWVQLARVLRPRTRACTPVPSDRRDKQPRYTEPAQPFEFGQIVR
jgi:hypothetical protein